MKFLIKFSLFKALFKVSKSKLDFFFKVQPHEFLQFQFNQYNVVSIFSTRNMGAKIEFIFIRSSIKIFEIIYPSIVNKNQ
ncbi:hypothetical protein BpHYR1_025037 [Brachionus plicatilis]|uniref:Uncharacterized protein n=1 Tax=Brachionus plicatilis TaxID=10195 RepID=A0A3M7RPC5_BRAPC|nr:hypothetical protein BpHYR1_025037 [Brachionus plicatilis]